MTKTLFRVMAGCRGFVQLLLPAVFENGRCGPSIEPFVPLPAYGEQEPISP